jgi:mRNA-degrading endonuclease RelE of RelBE toxin-antitoxin system
LAPGTEIDNPVIYKAKKFACKSNKGKGVKSGIRVIYAHDIENDSIDLIEIYHKSGTENENKERIRTYCNRYKNQGKVIGVK